MRNKKKVDGKSKESKKPTNRHRDRMKSAKNKNSDPNRKWLAAVPVMLQQIPIMLKRSGLS